MSISITDDHGVWILSHFHYQQDRPRLLPALLGPPASTSVYSTFKSSQTEEEKVKKYPPPFPQKSNDHKF